MVTLFFSGAAVVAATLLSAETNSIAKMAVCVSMSAVYFMVTVAVLLSDPGVVL